MTRTALLALVVPAALFWCAPALPAESYCTGARLTEEAVDRSFTKPMTYAVVQQGGRTVLQATGTIAAGEGTRLADALHKVGRVDEVWLHSPGGSATEGTRMGRVLRKAGVLTRLREGQACISACSVAFLGGLLRVVEPKSFFGIHMMTATRNTKLMIEMLDELGQLSRLRKSAIRQHLASDDVDRLISEAAGRYVRALEQAAATVAADQARFLVEMSVSLEFMTEEFAQSAQGVCYLGEAGLRKFNVSNVGAAPVPAAPAPAVAEAPLAATTTLAR